MTAPDKVWVDTFSKTDVGPTWLTKPVWASTEYIRADIAQAQIDQAKAETASAYEVAANVTVFEEDRPFSLRADFRDAIRALTPADAKAALDKMLADALTAQAAEIERLKGDCLTLAQQFDEFHPDPALMARIIINGQIHKGLAEQAEAERDAALARVAVLEGALGEAKYGLSWAVRYFKDQDVTKDDPCPPCTRGLSAIRAALIGAQVPDPAQIRADALREAVSLANTSINHGGLAMSMAHFLRAEDHATYRAAIDDYAAKIEALIGDAND